MTSYGFRLKVLGALLLLVLLALFRIGSAEAAVFPDIRSACWASGSLSEEVVSIARNTQRWSCDGGTISIAAERVLLRFDIDSAQVLPRYLITRRSPIEAVHFLAIDRDGAVRQASIPAADLSSSLAGGYFKASLPEVTRATRQVVVAIDLPSHQMTLERAYLAPTDAGSGASDMRFLLILAGLAGMLIMPLIFNAAFYRVLREPFVLWHSALTVMFLITIMLSSGLSVMLFDPRPVMLNWMTTMIFGLSVASGTMFTYHFIEPGLMHSHLRRLLPFCAIWAVFLSAFHAAFPFVARATQSTLYTAAFAPILAIVILALISALRRGSRAAPFQAIGYAPLVMVGLIRILTGVIPWTQSADAMLLFYIGCICEVLFTTLGMADRFVIMKLERDHAWSKAGLLARLSETDTLTGLLNRRAIERQFDQLRSEGFTTLAVIDLDHFKAINDVNGHAVGDAVLKAAANAFQAGPNVRAYRLGGEEFVLLLRGGDAATQAELRRQAIPAMVAKQVGVLDWLVTASMGITQVLGDEGFAKPYDRADKLLYEAKRAGRNRTQSTINTPISEAVLKQRGQV